jgi:hypothetical protein
VVTVAGVAGLDRKPLVSVMQIEVANIFRRQFNEDLTMVSSVQCPQLSAVSSSSFPYSYSSVGSTVLSNLFRERNRCRNMYLLLGVLWFSPRASQKSPSAWGVGGSLSQIWPCG